MFCCVVMDLMNQPSYPGSALSPLLSQFGHRPRPFQLYGRQGRAAVEAHHIPAAPTRTSERCTANRLPISGQYQR